jgi:hypothetical protein
LLCIGLARIASPAQGPEDPAYRAAVEADWAAQEKRFDRAAGSPEAIRAAIERAEELLADLPTVPGAPKFETEAAEIARLADEARRHDALDEAARLALYHKVRWLAREAALQNPLLGSKPILFMKRHRFICQMLHEYIGYYYDYANVEGGAVCVLEKPGRSFEIRDFTTEQFPEGNFATLTLSYDAKTIYFAWVERAPAKTPYYSPERRCFQVWAMDAGTGDLRQLTGGPDDNFDPCPLPDGGLAFMSTRRGGFGRCNNPWEPLPASTLHRMDADGKNVRMLSFHETNEWHPSVLNDGRIIYTRWDYVDRSAANFHGLWVANPDGTNTGILFGNYTTKINALYQGRPVPNSDKVLFVAGAHHADVGGSLVLVDPRKIHLDPKTGEDSLDAVERLTPEVCFAEAAGWPNTYYHSPWALSENYYLVSFSFDPLPGMSGKSNKDTETGIYLFDRFGGLELLYREQGISSMYPIPFAPRPKPPTIPNSLNPALGDEGEFVLTDVRQSLFPMPEGRPVTALRVFQLLPKTSTHISNDPRIGYANAESARMFLGTVPVEADGSAFFRAPARKPLYFQAVDATGRAVQSMRSAAYLQPGERRGCVGCHEPRRATPATKAPLAVRRAPSVIQPGPDGARPWSYARLMQPILDRRCARCHDGSAGDRKSALVLANATGGEFSQSYENLQPFVRWYEWGKGIPGFVTRPGHIGADESPLTAVLEDQHHGAQVGLTDEERRNIYLWLDGNAAFYGAYEKEERLAQRNGEAIAPPAVQ